MTRMQAVSFGGHGPAHDETVLETRKTMPDCPMCSTTSRDAAVASAPRVCPGCRSMWLPDDVAEPERHWRPRDVKGECNTLARWLPTIGGRGMSISPTAGTSGGAVNGRSDAVDENHHGLAKACRVLRHLDNLARSGHRIHVEVLWLAYVLTGDTLAEETSGKSRSRSVGRAERVAVAFASPELRERWGNHKSHVVRRSQPQEWGEKRIAEATAVYMGADAERGERRVGSSKTTVQVWRLVEQACAKDSDAP